MASELDLKLQAIIAQLNAPGGMLELGSIRRFNHDLPMITAAPPTLPAYIEQFGQMHTDAEFLVDGELRLTFGQTLALARRLARGLMARGLKKGDHVGIAARNSAGYVVAYCGVLMAGGCVALLNGWWSAEELAAGVDLAECKLVLADPDRAKRLAALELSSELVVFEHGDPEQGLAQLLAPAEDATPFPEIGPDDVATILYTSGSTGMSKAALSDHRAVVQATANYLGQTMAALMLMQAKGETPAYQPCSLVCVPLFHVTAEVPLFLQSFAMGRKLVLMPKWDAREAMRLIEKERVTYFVGVPLMSYEIATHPDRAQFDLSSCAHYAAGGAPRPIAHVDAIRKAFPTSFPLLGYGLTETNGVGCGNVNENYLAKPGSTGPASRPLVDLAILDDSGRPRPQGQPGEVAIRSVCNIREYYRNPEATAEAFNADGYFLTGDLGYLDEDGYLYLVGRQKDVIIRGGNNVHAGDVEAVLYEHPAVQEAAVTGVPHDVLGEDIGAWIVLAPDAAADAEELRAFCAERLSDYKVPRRITFVTELPRNATGKVVKAQLLDLP